jgi:archaellin
MKKLSKMKGNPDTRGEAGISKMILFIAMTLIVTVVGGGLIQYGTDLSGTAFNVGRDVRKYASSSYEIIGVVIADIELDQDVDQVYLTIRLKGGSEPLSLEFCTITLTSDRNHRAEYEYTSDLDGEDSDSFNVERADNTDSGSGQSGLITDPNGDFSLASPVISDGTVVQVHLDLEAGFGTEAVQSELVSVEIQSDTAAPCYIDFGIPEGIPSVLHHIK